MTYLFIIIITLLISFIVFEKNFKQLFFSKKKDFFSNNFFFYNFHWGLFLYYNLGYPYFSEEKLKKRKSKFITI